MKGGHDQGTVPEKNPYEVSTVASADPTRQPTSLTIVWALIVAIVAGVVVFFSTCIGTGLVLFELGRSVRDDSPELILLTVVIGVPAAGLTIFKSFRSVIRSRVSRYRDSATRGHETLE